MRTIFLAFLALIAAIFAQPATASVTYEYTGSLFTTFDSASCPQVCNITGTMTLATALGANESESVTPVSFSFTDGLSTIDSANAVAGPLGTSEFFFVTDAKSNIVGWNNQYFSSTNFMFSGSAPAGCTGCSVTDQSGTYSPIYYASNENTPGIWTLVPATAVPEPTTWAMLIMGVGMTGGGLRRKRHLSVRKTSYA